MRHWLLAAGCLATLAACGGSGSPTDGLANPASIFCEAQGASVELRTDEDGGQQGVCVFDDGSECDEWAFYRGDCAPTTDTTDEQTQATVAVRGRQFTSSPTRATRRRP